MVHSLKGEKAAACSHLGKACQCQLRLCQASFQAVSHLVRASWFVPCTLHPATDADHILGQGAKRLWHSSIA